MYLFQVHHILAEMVMGGMVLETNMNEIITQVDTQNKMEKSEVSRWLDSASSLWAFVYSMQACVYAAPCMLLSSNCGCSLPTLECLCSFRPLLLPLHCSQRRSRRGINYTSNHRLLYWLLTSTSVQCLAEFVTIKSHLI